MAKMGYWSPDEDKDLIMYWCEACGHKHVFSDKVHSFNGDFNLPTVTPSLMHVTGNEQCHSVIVHGIIHYQDDCTHAYKNQQMLLLDIEDKPLWS